MKEGDILRALSRVRAEVHDEVKAELAVLIADPRDLEEEWNALFGA